MINYILAQLPVPSTDKQFFALLLFLAVQSLIQLWQVRQGSKAQAIALDIKKQTNGLIEKTVQASSTIAFSQGELKGRIQEQARVADKLAIADEVAQKLAKVSAGEAAALAAALAAPAALAAALAAPSALAAAVPTGLTPDPDIHHIA